MPAQDAVSEPLYKVPTHLEIGATFGPIPERSFWVGISALAIGFFPAYLTYARINPGPRASSAEILTTGAIVLAVWLAPLFLLSPFLLTIFDPPPEHGLMCMLHFAIRRRNLQTQHVSSLRGVSFSDGAIHTQDGVRAVLALATVNLDLASVAGRRGHHNKLGYLFDGISTHPFQIVIRSKAQSEYECIRRMRRSKLPAAKRLAQWLADKYDKKSAIDRQRFMIIPADSEEILQDRVDLITRSLRQAGIDNVRIKDQDELRDFVNDWWPRYPHPERIGPGHVIESSNGLQVDSEFISVYAVSKLPPMIATNWWQPLVDGDTPVDVVMTCSQRDLRDAKWKLENKFTSLSASHMKAGREVAMAQIRELLLAYEGRVRPWNVQILMVVRGHDKATRDRSARRMVQQMADLGGKLDLLRWEQLRGMESAQPLCGQTMLYHTMYLESRTLVRTTPLAASTLQMMDGVIWGSSGSVPILLTTQHMKTGKHFGWYGFPGAGKGYGVRCYLARRVFADDLRVFMWDADKARHEYSGRFTEFLGGVCLKLSTMTKVKSVEIDPRWNVVAFDVSELDEQYWGAAFAHIKLVIEQHILSYPRETAFVIDEAMNIADHPDQQGARALASAVTQWRKYGCEVHVITQRVSDWFHNSIGVRVQDSLAVSWYGQQKETQISSVADKAHWTHEEAQRIAGAGIGQGLLVAFGRTVWADLFEQCSPEEHEAFETDPAERLELLAYEHNGIVSIAREG